LTLTNEAYEYHDQTTTQMEDHRAHRTDRSRTDSILSV